MLRLCDFPKDVIIVLLKLLKLFRPINSLLFKLETETSSDKTKYKPRRKNYVNSFIVYRFQKRL